MARLPRISHDRVIEALQTPGGARWRRSSATCRTIVPDARVGADTAASSLILQHAGSGSLRAREVAAIPGGIIRSNPATIVSVSSTNVSESSCPSIPVTFSAHAAPFRPMPGKAAWVVTPARSWAGRSLEHVRIRAGLHAAPRHHRQIAQSRSRAYASARSRTKASVIPAPSCVEALTLSRLRASHFAARGRARR
jgi:hypothetical protein